VDAFQHCRAFASSACAPRQITVKANSRARLPGTHTTTRLPTIEAGAYLPTAHTATYLPPAHPTTCLSSANTATHQPLAHTATHQPPADTATHPPTACAAATTNGGSHPSAHTRADTTRADLPEPTQLQLGKMPEDAHDTRQPPYRCDSVCCSVCGQQPAGRR
jgi:hypothetical protein